MSEWRRMIQEELERSRVKHPLWPHDPIHAATNLVEEAGEFLKAVNESCYEQGTRQEVIKEAIQVGAMVLRFLENVDRYDWVPARRSPD